MVRKKLKALVSAAFFILFSAVLGAQQSPKITLNVSDKPVKEIIERIETMTGYSFFYSHADVDVERKTSLKVENAELMSVLKTLFPEMIISVENSKILIERPEEDKAAKKTSSSLTLSGLVRDENSEPLPGVYVLVVLDGKQYGTASDIDGKYSLEFPAASVKPDTKVLYSCIGFADVQEKLSGRSRIDVVMSTDAQMLNETVVVGYGTQKKVNLTGAVSAVSAKEIEKRPVANIGQALQGMIPNLNVTQTSGRPDAGSNFNIRGNTSPNGGEPLILVDGVETNLARINPNDIESISILKDASSAAIYGARGAFGVILVTTKGGVSDAPPQVTLDARFSVAASTTSTDFETRGYYSAYIADRFLTTRQGVPYTSYTEEDYRRLWERRNDTVENPERPWVLTENRNGQLSYVYLANFDWYHWLYDDTRPTQDYNISVSGGGKNVNYLVSGRYYHQDGAFRVGKDDFDSYNLRTKVDIKIRPWLHLSTNVRFFASSYFYNGNDYRKPTLHALASFVPVNPDGTAVSHTLMTSSSSHYIMDGYSAMLYKGKQWGRLDRREITAKAALTADITKHLKFVADYSYSYRLSLIKYRDTSVEYSMYPGIIEQESPNNYKDRYDEEVSPTDFHVANAFFSYENTWNADHNFTGTVGVNYESYGRNYLKVRRDDLLTEELSDFNLATGKIDVLSGGVDEYQLAGLFYRFTYGYKGKYLFEMNGRLDGSSRFPKGNKWGFFPSASAAWRMSEESWFAGAKSVLNNLKIRASYGALGNQSISNYAYYQTVNTSGNMSYTFDGENKAGHATVTPPVSYGTWEKVVSMDVGVDVGLWRDQLTFSGDFYVRNTKGILTTGKKLPSIYGASEPLVNANNLRTTGWEIQLTWKDSFELGSQRFDYTIGGSLADYTAVYTKCDNPSGILSDPYVGKRLGEIWGFRVDGLFRDDAEALEYSNNVNLSYPYGVDYTSVGDYGRGVRGGDLKYLDLNNDHVVNPGSNTLEDPGDRRVIGNSQPRFSYGLNLGANFYGFDLSIFFQGIGHQDWYPGADNLRFWGPYSRPYASFVGRDFMADVWTETNTDAYFPRTRGYASLNGMLYYTNDRYLQNLAYIRLKSLSFGYSLPKKVMDKIKMEGIRIYFAGENLWYWSPLHSKYVDPEQLSTEGNNANGNVYSYCKTFSFGVNIKF